MVSISLVGQPLQEKETTLTHAAIIVGVEILATRKDGILRTTLNRLVPSDRSEDHGLWKNRHQPGFSSRVGA